MRRLRLAIAVLLFVSLASSTVRAAELVGSVGAARFLEEKTTLDLKALLVRISAGFVSIFEKTGCAIDPAGRCTSAPTGDEGCAIDPLGGSCRG